MGSAKLNVTEAALEFSLLLYYGCRAPANSYFTWKNETAELTEPKELIKETQRYGAICYLSLGRIQKGTGESSQLDEEKKMKNELSSDMRLMNWK